MQIRWPSTVPTPGSVRTTCSYFKGGLETQPLNRKLRRSPRTICADACQKLQSGGSTLNLQVTRVCKRKIPGSTNADSWKVSYRSSSPKTMPRILVKSSISTTQEETMPRSLSGIGRCTSQLSTVTCRGEQHRHGTGSRRCQHESSRCSNPVATTIWS